MAENHFRLDLGYEEMGFRSQLSLNEFDSSAGGFESLRRSYRDPYVSNVMDTLSDQFSSLSLLRRKIIPILPLPSTLQPLRRQGSKSDQRLYGGRTKLSLGTTTDPFYELNLSSLCKNESKQDIKDMVLKRQEARLHKGGLVHRNGNVLKKESVGTGVFHPLRFPQRPTYKTPSLPKKRYQRNHNQSKKELMTKERRGVIRTTSTWQQKEDQDECHYHLPSDMDFSKDWTF